jgi:transposase
MIAHSERISLAAQQHPSIAPTELVAGVDTHTDTHTLAVLTAQGATVLTESFPADQHGYKCLIDALCSAGEVTVVGVEGTNSYGAGLARALTAAGFLVKEVLRPTRRVRRMHGKSDPIDAVEAARTLLNGQPVSEAKDTDTPAESLRMLLTARSQLVTTATALGNTITSLLVTAPESVRAKYRSLTTKTLIERLCASRPGTDLQDPRTAAIQSMRTMAQFHQDASARAGQVKEQMRQLLQAHYPQLLGLYGVGTIVAAQLVVTAGGNPQRIRSEAAFASLCGVAPLPASSGRTNRHRLNRGGDRRGNSALHRIALVRMQRDQRTKDYITRRTSEGKSKREIMRCLKRAIAREIYRALVTEEPLEAHPDFSAKRKAKGLTLTQAANALHTWPARISDIEKQRRPLPELTDRYREWLQAA